MAEPRRSGRATKGQHTKKLDTSTAPSKSKKAAKSDDSDGENSEIIRCVCGATAEDDDDERMMICCDECGVWQHNECMGLTEDEDSVPENYWCEQCKPENHKELLEAMARGEKPWEERQKAREEAEAERKRKKKGKPKKSKPEEAPPKEDQKDVVMEEASANGDKAKEDTLRSKRASVSGKRKLRGDVDDSPDWSEEQTVSPCKCADLTSKEPSKKVRKLTSPLNDEFPRPPKTPTGKAPKAKLPERKSSKGEPIQTDKVEKLEDLLNATRKSVATLFVKAFVEYFSQAQKEGTVSIKSADASGAAYGLGLEHALFMELSSSSADPSPEYRAKARSTLFNLKQNPSLRQKLTSGEVSVEELALMNTEEMASEEQQKADEQMKKEAEKQVVLVADDGPRIRRTHKGEELVDDSADHGRNESIFATAVPRVPSAEPDQDRGDSTSSDESEQEIEEVELPETIHKEHTRSPSITAAPLRIDTDTPRAPERKSSNFNIEEIWSSVKSADPDKRVMSGSLAASPSIQQTPIIPQLHDPEVDQLLKDEDMDSPPYSPPEHDDDVDQNRVWSGTLLMNKIAEFSANAYHFGGLDISSRMPWTQLLATSIVIDGRIDTERANNYLCDSHYSPSTDVVILRILPHNDPTSRDEFDRLFDYFRSKNRYGVVGKSHILPVKDIYVLPVERGSEPLPAILDVLPNLADSLEAPRAERFLLLSSVVKGSGSAPPRSASVSIAPPVPSTDQTPARDVFAPSVYPPPTPTFSSPTAVSTIPPHLAGAPTLKHLLEQAPNIGPAEMKLVQEILEGDVLARTDLGRLTALLVERQRRFVG